jgi:peptidyl-prolyl cis-trans isomerase D
MLDALRRGATGIVAKILLGLLILSFAIWGVADVFRGYGAGSLARVGKHEITADEFQRAYQDEMAAISQQFGRRLTPEQARQFGIDARVLSRLVGSAAIDTHASELKLGISEKALAEAVQNDPTFKGIDGRFNREAFNQILRQMGLSERGYFMQRRQDEMRGQLTGSLLTGITPPAPMIDALHAWREETRTVTHFTIDADKVVKVGEPDEAALKKTWEENKRQFMTPELRKLSALLLSGDDVRKELAIPEADLRAAYDQDRQAYDTPERRKLQQIAFRDKAAADAARAAILKGKSFLDAAKEAGAQPSDIELGLVTKQQMIDPVIAEAAFKLAKDRVSDVVEGKFATVLLRATEIQPGVQRTFDQVKDQVRDKLARERADPVIHKLHDEVDDLRGAGKTLKEVADAKKLKLFEVAAVDRSGKGPDGKPAIEHADAAEIVARGFEGAVGIETETVELSDGGYAWIEVLAVTPEKERPFEDVKDDVRKLWVERERDKALSELATKLIERAEKGEPLEKLAAEVGGKLDTTTPFTRTTTPQGLSERATQLAFAIANGKLASADSAKPGSRTVFRLTEITLPAAPTAEQRKKLEGELTRQLQNDAVVEYVSALQDRLGLSVNEQAIRRVLGLEARQ